MDSDPPSPRRQTWPGLARGQRLYCIGDIHGRLDLLDGVLRRITADLAADPIADLLFVFLGDYVDRGPNSFGVIDRLSALSGIVPTVFLKGNHEAILIDFLWQPLVLPFWKSMGGYPDAAVLRTRAAPATNRPGLLQPRRHASGRDAGQPSRLSSNRCKLRIRRGTTCSPTQGIDPGRPLDQQTERDLLWIRETFLKSTRRFDKFIVHGHTPVKDPEVTVNRVNIDTGAYATGRLTCLVLEEDTRRFL